MNLTENVKEAALPAWLIEHPLIASILKEKADGVLNTRAAARAELDRLDKEADDIIPGLQKKIADAETKLKVLESQRQELLRKQGEAGQSLRDVRFTLDRGRQKQSAILRETSDPAIDDAINFFREKLGKLRAPTTIRESESKGERLINDKFPITLHTNRAAVLAAVSYVKEAMEKLEVMKLSPTLDTEGIEALKTGIPAIDVFVVSTNVAFPLDSFAEMPGEPSSYVLM